MSILVLLAIAALQTPPQQWVFAGGDADTGFAIDKGAVRRSGSTVTAWVMVIPNRPLPNQHLGMVDHLMTQTRYDCDDLTLKDISRFIYRTDGSLGHSTTSIPDAPVAPPPGSTGSTILSLLCTPGAMDNLDVFGSAQDMRDSFRVQQGSK